MTQPASSTAPLAQISRSALLENLSIGPRDVYVDARHDGWGHGAALVTEVAREAGLAGVVGAQVQAFRETSGEEIAVITAAGAYGFLPDTRPVLRLSGQVVTTKRLRAGEGVSYGYVHRAASDTRVALVTGGYAQGIVRSLGSQLEVLVAGARCPILGRVAMDACVVEIGDLAVADGDEVIFLGDPQRGEPSIAEWQRITGMSAEELIVQIGNRARREVVA